jgi:hypothetical protein
MLRIEPDRVTHAIESLLAAAPDARAATP